MSGAKKSRASKSGKERRKYAGRPVFRIPTRPVIMIAPDDCRTAVSYFNSIKTSLKDKITIHIVSAPHDGADPEAVVSNAICHAKRLFASGAKHANDRQAVFALIDMEREQSRRDKAIATATAHQNGCVRVLLSDPCFEVWTLLHFVDTGEYFADCDAVRQAIKPHWQKVLGQPFESKVQADYYKLLSMIDLAIDRARKHCEPTRDNSWTEVYVAMKEVASLAASP